MAGLVDQLVAVAQGGGGQADPMAGCAQTLAFLGIIVAIFYFMVIRPQQKKAKEHQELLSKLKKNDEVMTSGGIYGKVVDLKDTVVTMEVAPNVRIRVARPQIATVIGAEKSVAKTGKE